MARDVLVIGGQVRYVQTISVGHHVLQADEPVEAGGRDVGPDPYELLLTALGSCMSITLRMYADRKRWPLEDVRIRLSYGWVYMDDCATCDGELKLTNAIEVQLALIGDLSEVQRRRFLEIAQNCPVHLTLRSPIPIHTTLAP
jgi:putative redox protein